MILPGLSSDVRGKDIISSSSKADCFAYIGLFSYGYTVAQIPFGGTSGTLIMNAARTVRKIQLISRKIKRQRGHLERTLASFKDVSAVLKRPLLSLRLAVITSGISMFWLVSPCLMLGTVAMSVGFWRRQHLQGFLNHTVLLTVILVLGLVNAASTVVIWYFADIVDAVLWFVPFVEVIISITVNCKIKLVVTVTTFVSTGIFCLTVFAIVVRAWPER